MAVRFHLSIRQPGRHVLDVVVRDSLAIGRDCDGLLLADPQVSRVHAEFRQSGDELVVVDLGSTNGTFVNGRAAHTQTVVHAGDEVRIGDSNVSVAVEADPWEPGRLTHTGSQSTIDIAEERLRISQAVDRISPAVTAPWANETAPASDSEGVDIDGLPATMAHDVLATGDNQRVDDGVDLRGRGRQGETLRVTQVDLNTESTWKYGRTSIVDAFLAELADADLTLGVHGPDGTITVAVTELADATHRSEQFGPVRWAECEKTWESIVADAAAEAGGRRLFGHQHAFAFAFPSPRRAVRWGLRANAALAEYVEVADRVTARIGLHLEDYDPRQPEGLRDITVIAAGIAQAAAGGEILASTTARNVAVDRHRLRFGATRLVPQAAGAGLIEVAAADVTAEVPRE